MSLPQVIKEAGIKLSATQKEQIRNRIANLRLRRKILETLIRTEVRKHRVKGQWKGREGKKALARVLELQEKRTKVNLSLWKLGAQKKKNPEFDSD